MTDRQKGSISIHKLCAKSVLRTWRSASAFAFVIIATQAQAHPHIFIDANAEVTFDSAGQAVAIRNIWSFDAPFSAYAVQGYDTNDDGKFTRNELQPLAAVNIKSLAAYHFFTEVSVDGASVPLRPPQNYWDEFANDALTLRFTLPFAHPVVVKGKSLEIKVYDPEYFAAISFAAKQPISLVGVSGCKIDIRRPTPLDPSVAGRLAVIPADQRELPDDLLQVTSKLVNGATIECP